MAWSLDPYANFDEYKQRNGRVSDADQASIEEMLSTVCRVVDRRLRVPPGMFAPQESTRFEFPAYGGTRLNLRDAAGYQYLLRTPTADLIEVDDGDGTYTAYTLDFADAWVRGFPENASTFSEPYTAIDILPHVTSANPSEWPNIITGVRITGTWGWATTPGAIKERVIGITRELVDAHHAGMSASVEEMIQSIPTARALMHMLEREFNYRIPVF